MSAVVRPAISPYGYVAGLATWKVGGEGGRVGRWPRGGPEALQLPWGRLEAAPSRWVGPGIRRR